MLRPTLLAAVLIGATACRSARPVDDARVQAAGGTVATATAQPLASLATVRVLVTPIAALADRDPMSWNGRAGDPGAFLRTLDAAIASALSSRASLPWVYADALGRSHRRNASLSSDPYRLSVDALRAAPPGRPPQFAGEPLASQLRGMVALQEDARMVLLPVELRFEPALDVSDIHARAVLRLALVDARSTEVRWLGEVRSDAFTTVSAPALTSSLAAGVADLVAPSPVAP